MKLLVCIILYIIYINRIIKKEEMNVISVLLLYLNILIIACLLIGIVVCAMGMKTKNIVYKGGFYLFLLFFIQKMYSLIVPICITKIIERETHNPGILLRNLNIPPLIFTSVALVIFIIYLFKGLNKSSNN